MNFLSRPVSTTLLSNFRVLSVEGLGLNVTLGKWGKRFLLGNFTLGDFADLCEFRFCKLSLRIGSIRPIRFGFDGLLTLFDDLSLSLIPIDLFICSDNLDLELDLEFVRLGLENRCCSCIFSVVGFGLDLDLDLNRLLVLVGALVGASVVSFTLNLGAIESLVSVLGLTVLGSRSVCCFSALGLGLLRMGVFLAGLLTISAANDAFNGFAVVTKLLCLNLDRPRDRTLFLVCGCCFVVSS